MDTEFQAGLKGYNLAKKRHVPVVVMEPLRGGALADLQGDIAEILQNAEPNRSIASWGYRWVAGHDNVKVVLSGMSEYDQVTDNLNTFTDFQPLNEEEMKAIDKVKTAIESRVKNNCTGCRYCMPCPAGVNIPGSFQIWNTYAMYGNAVKAKNSFAQLTEKERPDNCVKCGKCEAACPQHIAIRTDLEEVTKTMAGLKNV
jgi:predicted aldo/keto reductase-like oxidoreductase